MKWKYGMSKPQHLCEEFYRSMTSAERRELTRQQLNLLRRRRSNYNLSQRMETNKRAGKNLI